MSDTGPQAILGFDPAIIQAIVDERIAAQRKGPSRIAIAASYIVDRLREPSSIAGLGVLAIPVMSHFGVSLSDEGWGQVVQIVVGIAGVAAIALREGGAAGDQSR